MTKIMPKNKLLIILALSFLLRLCFILVYPQLPVESDASGYDHIGVNIAEGRGFLNELGIASEGRAPGYPLFLAVIYRSFGHSYNYVRFFQIFFSMLSIIFIYLLARDIFGPKVAYLSAGISAIYLPFISYNGLLLTESVFTACLVIYLYLFLRCLRAGSLLLYIFLGLLGGFAALVREVFVAFLIIYFFLGILYFKEKLSRGIFILLIALAIITPWTIRNYRVFNRFILISNQGSGVLWLASHKGDLLEWYCQGEDCKSGTKSMPTLREGNSLLREGLKNMGEHPLVYIKLCFKRLFRFWVGSHSNTLYGLEGSFNRYLQNRDYSIVALKSAFLIFNTLLVLLGFYGIYAALKRIRQKRRQVISILLPIFIISMVHFFLFSTLRYQVPIMPFMIIFASFAITVLFNHQINKDGVYNKGS